MKNTFTTLLKTLLVLPLQLARKGRTTCQPRLPQEGAQVFLPLLKKLKRTASGTVVLCRQVTSQNVYSCLHTMGYDVSHASCSNSLIIKQRRSTALVALALANRPRDGQALTVQDVALARDLASLEQQQQVMVVTAGIISPQAVHFARRHNIVLIDGVLLQRMLQREPAATLWQRIMGWHYAG
jgi:hypothetical protein